jgi:hypothetical protein
MTASRLSKVLATGGATLALVTLLSACASKGNNPVTVANSGKIFAVTADKTSFFRYGPQQGNGADQELPKDTLVTLIRPSFGYSKVQLVEGSLEGYVASEDIRPAPPTLLASLNPATADPTISSDRENFDVQSSEPPPPEALPDPDLPPTSADPTQVPLP